LKDLNVKYVTGAWRRLHNEELYVVYAPNIIWVTKSRKVRLAGNVAVMRESGGA
jgi:hypothetical protein